MATTPLLRLLQAWNKTPDESLRALILAHDDAAPFEPLKDLASLKIAQALDQLLTFNPTPKDPRLTRALEGLLTSVPWSSDGSKGLWKQVFKLVAASGDPRFTELTPAFKVRPLMQTWLKAEFGKATANLPKAFAARAEAKWKTELDALQKATPRKKAGGAKDDTQLLAEIFANPTENGPRLVYADLLLERGDPRGEFISLQCGDGNPKREKALLKEHEKKWLAAFGPCLNVGVEWKRGFPFRGTVKFKNQQLAEQYGALPDWATFEELTWSEPGATPATQRHWTLHVSKAFRHLRVAHAPYFPLMLDVKEPWALETLSTDAFSETDLRRFADSALFPKLHTLILRGQTAPLWFKGLKKLGNVKRLQLWSGERLDLWLPIVNTLPIDDFWVGPIVRLSRAADRQFTKLNFHVDAAVGHAWRDAQDLLPGYVTEVTFSGNGELKPAVETMVREKVRKKGAADPFKGREEGSLAGVQLNGSVLWLDTALVAVTSSDRVMVVDVKSKRIVREFAIASGTLLRLVGDQAWLRDYMGLRPFDAKTGPSSARIECRQEGQAHFIPARDGSTVSLGRTVVDLKSGKIIPPPRGWKEALRFPDDSGAVQWKKPGQPYEALVPGKKGVPLEGGNSFVGILPLPDEGSFIGRADTGLVKWEVATGRALARCEIHSDERHPQPLQPSRDRRFVFVPSTRHSVLIATLPGLKKVVDVKVPGDIQAVDLSPDLRQLAVVAKYELHFVAVPPLS